MTSLAEIVTDEGVIDENAIDALGSPREINRVMIRVQRLRHAKVKELRAAHDRPCPGGEGRHGGVRAGVPVR